ncbi:MAG TPA: flagellar hook-basal body complex protein [Lysobacter sp.]
MIDALYISASGLRSEQKQIDVISNNVANMQTPGFKKSRVNFADVATAPAQQAAVDGGAPQPPADMRVAGTRVVSTITQFDKGEVRATGNPLDLAIDGAGLFELERDDGSLVYTRDGQFRLDGEGVLRSMQGLRLANAPQVPLEATDVQISASGEISIRMPDDAERTVLGRIELALFGAADGLVAKGDNQFAASEQAGVASYAAPGESGAGSLQSGSVELANVEMIEEMSNLVLAQRAYQLNARVLQAADQVMETINNLRR